MFYERKTSSATTMGKAADGQDQCYCASWRGRGSRGKDHEAMGGEDAGKVLHIGGNLLSIRSEGVGSSRQQD